MTATSMKTSRTAKQVLTALLLGTFLLKTLLILLHGQAYDYGSDDRGYLESARILLEKGMFTYNDPTRPTVFITPALPGVLAAVMELTGPGPALEQTFRVLQAGMVTSALLLLFLIGKRLFRERTALWAVGICNFYPPLWLVSAFIFTEAMFTLFVMLLVYTALRAMEQPSLRRAALFGLLWAGAVYVRPTIALWPGIVFLLYIYWRCIPWKTLIRCGIVTAMVFILCLLPWWMRNYEVSGGEFIPLTKSGGNPLLLGTYPYVTPSLEEQRTWHTTNDLWVNDAQDTERAKERIKMGFAEHPFVYASWYTVGKFVYFWGDVFYWIPLPGVPLAAAVLYHYAMLIPGFLGIFRSVRTRSRSVTLVVSLLAYLTLLHMVYLAHSRYSVPLMPFIALFAAYFVLEKRSRKVYNNEDFSQQHYAKKGKVAKEPS